jgi:hypothetical protein
MNDNLNSPNSAPSIDHLTPIRPEDLQAGNGSEAAGQELAPMPGSSPSPSSLPLQTTQPVRLSADEVAAAIAATPSPPTPLAGMPAPSTAGDVDVIEPEWVNKAEAVVIEHRGDPYGEEEAIEDLQQDYLKKRYGYDVANPNVDSSKPKGT